MTSELNNKIALVTGASRGIGKAIALELAAAGCDLMLTARDRDALTGTADAIRKLGRRAEIHAADLMGAGEPERLAAAVRDAFGGLDILVNNAGITKDNLLLRMSEDDWDDILNIHLKALLYVCHQVNKVSYLICPYNFYIL